MNTKTILKKRIWIFLLTVGFIIICLLTTYGMNKDKGDGDRVIDNPSLTVTYKDGDKGIKTPEYPLNYNEGISKAPDNIINIENKTNENVSYQLLIMASHDSNSLDVSKIYVSVNDKEPVLLSNISDYVVYENTLLGNEQNDVKLKVWIGNELVDQSDNGKSLSINIKVREKNNAES